MPLEHFRQRDLALEQVRFLDGFENHIAVHTGACVMASCQQHRAGRSADGGPSVEIGETHALRSETVECGRLDRAAVAADVLPAQVIGQEHNDIRSFGCRQAGARHQEQRQRNAPEGVL